MAKESERRQKKATEGKRRQRKAREGDGKQEKATESNGRRQNEKQKIFYSLIPKPSFAFSCLP